tara:strand:- start:32 stop:1687 length:1656 start_codon:yes stop_codon:yes gene_type:complete
MSKPGKSLKSMCKKLGIRLTVKRGKKRVYKSVAVLKRQCANKKKKKVKRKRRFGTRTDKWKIIRRRREERNKKEYWIDPWKSPSPYISPRKSLKYIERKKSLRKKMNEQQISREEFNKLRKKIINERKKLRIWKDVVLRQTNKPLKIKKGRVHGEAKQIGQFKYTIPGSKGKKYEVNLLTMECTCPNFTYRRSGFHIESPDRCCKHIDSVFEQKRISQKDWLEHLGVAESVDPEVMKLLEKFRISDQKFGRKKIIRKRNKMKKEKISSSLKKLCKKHGVRLTVKRKGKRVYKSVKVLKGQCKRKTSKKKKVKRRRRRRKFGAALVSYSSGDEEYDYSDDEEMDQIFNQVNAALTLQALQRGRQARKKFKEKREKYRKMSPIQQIGYHRNEKRRASQEQEQEKKQEAVLKKVMEQEVARREAARREAEKKEKLKNKLENDLRNLSVNNGIVDNGKIIRPLWSLYGQVKDLTENLSMTETTIEHFVNNIVQRKTEEGAKELVKRITEDVNKWKRGDIPISDLNLGAYNFGRRKRKKKKRKVKRKRKKKRKRRK